MFNEIQELKHRKEMLEGEIGNLLLELDAKESELKQTSDKLDKVLHIKRCKFCDRKIDKNFKLARVVTMGDGGVNIVNHVVCEQCFKGMTFMK